MQSTDKNFKKWFLKKPSREKVDILRSIKESGDLRTYLTLVHWLIDETPEKDALSVQSIPDDAFWNVK